MGKIINFVVERNRLEIERLEECLRQKMSATQTTKPPEKNLPDNLVSNIRLSRKLLEKCKGIHRNEYSTFSFKEFMTVMISWGLREAELRMEVKQSLRKKMSKNCQS